MRLAAGGAADRLYHAQRRPVHQRGGSRLSLNGLAGAGGSLRQAGYPSAIPGASTNNYDDIGAARHRDVAGSVQGGGSGGLFYTGD
jgi:hypothetical protein